MDGWYLGIMKNIAAIKNDLLIRKMEAIRDIFGRYFISSPKDKADYSIKFSNELNRKYYKLADLSNSSIATFWSEYMEAVEEYLTKVKNNKINEYFDIVRYLKDHIPIFIQLTIKTRKDCSNDISDGKFIPVMVAICQKSIKDNLIIKDDSHLDTIIAVTAEDDEPDTVDGFYVQNIRIHFPKIMTHTNILRNIKESIISYTSEYSVLQYLRNDSVDFHRNIKIYGMENNEIPIYPSCSFDDHICRPVEAYADYYRLLNIQEIIKYDYKYSTDNNIFDVREHNAIKNMGMIELSDFEQHRDIEDINFYIPFILNGNYQSIFHYSKTSATELGIKSNDSYQDTTHIKYIEDLIKLISYDYKKYHYLLKICAALVNQFKNDRDIGLRIWKNLVLDVAKNAPQMLEDMNITDTSIEKYYSEFDGHSENYTIKTIKYLARISNKNEYKSFSFRRIVEIIRESNPPSKKHVDDKLMADVIAEYFDDIVFTSFSERKWFIYDYHNKKHHLKSSPDNAKVQYLISKFMLSDMEKILKNVIEDYYNLGSEIEIVKNRMNAIIHRMKSGTNISISLKYAKPYFNKDDMETKLDVNLSVFGCDNGVFDIIDDNISKISCVKFRAGLPEDLITRYAPTPYIKHTYGDDKIEMVEKYVMQLIGQNCEMKDFLLKVMASCLRGNKLKYFIIMTGETDAGKSTFKKLLEATLGYGMVHTINNSVITSTNPVKSGNANDELAKSIGARYVATQETNARLQKLSNNSVKNLTGGDTQQIRTLFKEGFIATQTGTLMLLCNDIPTFDLIDNAVAKRLCIFQFKSKFIEGAPKSEEEQRKRNEYPIDRQFDTKLEMLRKPFLWLLIQKLKEVLENGGERISIPEPVVEATKHYIKQTDSHRRYIEENMEFVEGEEVAPIKLSLVAGKFRSWKTQEDKDFKFNSAIDTEQLIEQLGRHNIEEIKNVKNVINYRFKEQ